MDDLKQPSEAQSTVQEQGAAEASAVLGDDSPGMTPSEAATPVQEQQSEEQKPALSVEEQIRRGIQSGRDQIMHTARMQALQELTQQQQAAAAQAQISSMDDEQFGAYMRQAQAQQAEKAQLQANVTAQVAVRLREKALAMVSDSKARHDVEMRDLGNEFRTYDEFVGACQEAELQTRLGKERSKLEKTLRETAIKEATAVTANAVSPTLGAGLPTSSLDIRKMSTEQLLAAGFEEALRNAKR
jgi:hypothetical protein